jgi:hypothetical protein
MVAESVRFGARELGEKIAGAIMKTEALEEFARRHDREGDWEARQMFSESDLRMSPEEYAARRIHLWGCFSLHYCRFRDPALGAWVRRFGELFDQPDEVERYRQQFLTADERTKVARQATEPF